MRYHHKLGSEYTTTSESTSFHLSRKAGGYFSLGLPNVTHYQGLTAILPWGDMWELFKTVDSITINDTPEAIVLLEDTAERVYRNALERFTTQRGASVYEVTQYTGPVRVTLDMRMIHDFDTWGRHYTIQDVPGGHVVTYHCPKYTFCLAILGAQGRWKENWREEEYSYDARRNSNNKKWVFDCLEYSCSRTLSLRFGVGWNPQEAIAQANDTIAQQHTLTTKNNDTALRTAITDLDGLIVALPKLDLGILAGYPWFYQVYTRDEAISSGALIALGDHEQAKKILLRELHHLHSDGRISNRFPNSEIASADSVGWAFLRLGKLFAEGKLTNEELIYVHRLLSESLQGLQEHHLRDGLVTNGWKETWMDTTGGFEDGRKGARIEIQALTLAMYHFMKELCAKIGDGDTEYYSRKEELLRATVRERFFDSVTNTLADGIDDHVDRTIRPNIFLAHYAYADLLTQDEWHRVFERALRALWQPWGGLTTIDKEHLLFTPRYSGENDRSYHRGDSWYFINNFAAIGLLHTGFKTEAEQIYEASKKQILSIGIPGHAAETSSAEKQEGFGCFSQAWSAATFVELHLALRGPNY